VPVLFRVLLILAGIVVVIFIGFQIHWLIGAGIIAGLLGYVVYVNYTTFYVMRANAVYMQGDMGKALSLLEKAFKSKQGKPQHGISYAFILMKDGNPEKAEQVLKELLTASKSEDIRMQVKSHLATAYWLLGKQDEAVSLLEEVYGEYKTVTIVGNLGYFKILKGELESALEFNQAAYEYDDSDVTILDNLAQNYYLLGRMEEAAEMYEKVIEKAPKHAESYYYYALTLEALGRHDEAAEQAGLAFERPLALVTPISREDVEQLKLRLELLKEDQ
jgi:tetratricopeptide (TPR) repeat protein